MNGHATGIVRSNGRSSESNARVVRIVHRTSAAQVNVEIGNGAIAPKVALQRAKTRAPVKVEIGNGAIAPKVALQRAK
jgi:hypothetical protein